VERQIIYQFCLANYDSNKEFLMRIKRFLKAFKKSFGDVQDPLMLESTFKDLENNTMILVDIIPPFYMPTIHEFDLSPNFDDIKTFLLVEDIIRGLDKTKPYHPNLFDINETSILIKFIHRVKILPDCICQKDL